MPADCSEQSVCLFFSEVNRGRSLANKLPGTGGVEGWREGGRSTREEDGKMLVRFRGNSSRSPEL